MLLTAGELSDTLAWSQPPTRSPQASVLFAYLVSHKIRCPEITLEMISSDVFILKMKEKRLKMFEYTFPWYRHFRLHLFS
jgi:hypothetical protein